MERQPIQRVLDKMAKGLYFLDTGQVLPDDVQIRSSYFSEPDDLVSPPLDDAIRGASRTSYGNDVVTCWRNQVKDDPTASLTWLQFFKDKTFLICTFRREIGELAGEAL